MYTKPEIVIFHVNTEGQSSGDKTFTNADGIVDILEFKQACKDSNKVVMICLCPTNGTTMQEEIFVKTAKLLPDADYNDIYCFACYSRNASAVMNRKMIFKFGKDDTNPTVRVYYYNS